MRIVTLSEVREELQGHIKRQELFPIIGSGFTKGCKTRRGEIVPSGEDMKDYMKQYLEEHGNPVSGDNAFSKIARYYEAMAKKSDFWQYLRTHFIDVDLSGERRNFLKINWKFIYTLNLDDAIERNSPYSCTVLPNRRCNLDMLAEEKCLFKLHGDAKELIKYGNEKDSVLSFTQYIESLETNKSLLEKLCVDLTFSNTIFIGCSLSDELDLLSVARHLKEKHTVQRNRYFVSRKRPDKFQEIDLMDYGIDTVIIVDNYEEFYKDFSDLANKCTHVMTEELKTFRNLKCEKPRKNNNIDYLLCGKFLLDKSKRQLFLPDFFIERDLEKDILADMYEKRIQIVHGARVSGKSYLLAGLLQKTRNRDTYFFDSRSQVDIRLLDFLLKEQHCALFFDTNVLTLDAMKMLLRTDCNQLAQNQTNVVICVNNSDRDILELISDIGICSSRIGRYELSNRFITGGKKQSQEFEIINTKLKQNMLIPFAPGQTILDNLLDMQRKLRTDKPTKFDPPLRLYSGDIGKFCLMILLALNEKVTASELVQCSLLRESAALLQELKVTVEEDHRSLLFLNAIDSASYQIVCNAKVWLLNQLQDAGQNVALEQTIVDAFRRLVRAFLSGTRQFKRVERLVKFDKLNEIFPDGKRLIIKIYDGLRPLLSESYQYFHQLAKCHLWGISKQNFGEKELEPARIAAITAKRIVEEEITQSKAYNHQMARAHILNTLTIIYTKLCIIEEFRRINSIEETVDYFYAAICCPENSEAMSQAKGATFGSADKDGNIIKQWILKISAGNVIPTNSKEKASKILTYWRNL